MTPDDLGKLAQKPGPANKLRPELLAPARQIAGTIGFIVTQVRIDGYLVFCIIARYLSEKRLTQQAWICLLRLGHNLVATIELPLILRRSPPGAEMLAFVDSAKGNVDGGRSQGGFFCCFPGSGALCWSSSAPSQTADSSSAPELHQATRCAKAVTGLRIFLRELQTPPTRPTDTFTDAQVVIDATKSGKVTKESKWVCTAAAGNDSLLRSVWCRQVHQNRGRIQPRRHADQAATGGSVQAAPSRRARARATFLARELDGAMSDSLARFGQVGAHESPAHGRTRTNRAHPGPSSLPLRCPELGSPLSLFLSLFPPFFLSPSQRIFPLPWSAQMPHPKSGLYRRTEERLNTEILKVH